MRGILVKGGKFLSRGGSLVSASDPKDCDCCGNPPPQLWCCDGGVEGFFCGERYFLPGVGEMIGDAPIGICQSVRPVADCSECSEPPPPCVGITDDFGNVVGTTPGQIDIFFRYSNDNSDPTGPCIFITGAYEVKGCGCDVTIGEVEAILGQSLYQQYGDQATYLPPFNAGQQCDMPGPTVNGGYNNLWKFRTVDSLQCPEPPPCDGRCPDGYVGSGLIEGGIACCPESHPFHQGNCMCTVDDKFIDPVSCVIVCNPLP